jgi:hypothetical protein
LALRPRENDRQVTHPEPGFLDRQLVTNVPKAQAAGRLGVGLTTLGVGLSNSSAPLHVANVVSLSAPASVALAFVPTAVQLPSAITAKNRENRLKDIQRAVQENKYHPSEKDDFLAHTILPYVIKQQGKRVRRKLFQSFPGSSAYQLGRNIYKHYKKKWAGTLHKDRKFYSDILAYHISDRTSGLKLGRDIVGALFSEKRLNTLSGMAAEESSPLIYRRLSTTK